MKHILSILFIACLSAGCGAISTDTNEGANPGGSPAAPESTAIVHITDFFSSALISTVGNLTSAQEEDISINVVAPVPHTDAILRAFQGLLYIVNRWGRDSIQVVDPDAGFETIAEFSTGGGTNPQDILVLSDTKAYITLYQPEATGAEELIVVNPQDGSVLKSIDLSGLVDDDGEQLARPTRMTLVEDEVWILMQDLDGFYQVVTNGKIGVVDTNTDTLVDTDSGETGIQGIELDGRNPNDIAYNADTGLVYVTDTGVFEPDFTTDTSNDFGGIEVIDTESYTSNGIIIDDANLGGYPGRIQIASEELGFVVTNSKRIVAFESGGPSVLNTNVYESPGTFLPDILLDGNGHLLVAERGDFEGQGAGLVILDIEDNFSQQGPLDVGGPPNSLAVIE